MKPLTYTGLYRLVVLMIAGTIPFAAGSFNAMQSAHKAVVDTVSTGKKMRSLGDILSAASDRLTDEARSFAVGGDRERLKAYWEEIEVARSREQAVAGMDGMDLPESERALLVDAKRESDRLMEQDIRAMRLAAEYAELEPAYLPSRVAAFNLSPDDARLSPLKKKETALFLLYSPEYRESKRMIRANINEFKSIAFQRVDRAFRQAQEQRRTSIVMLFTAVLIQAAGAALISLLSYTQFMRPMTRYLSILSAPSPGGHLPELVPSGGAGPRALAGILNARREEIQRYQTELENAKLRSDSYFHFLPLAAVETNNENVVTMWNPAAERLFGYLASEAVGRDIVELLVTDGHRQRVLDFIEHSKLLDGVDDHINENRTKAGRTILCEWCNTPINDAEGRRTGWASIVRDVTEERREAEQILYLARHDPLTGLLNRRHMTERINDEIARIQRSARPFSLIMLDIDFFKTFNDTYGHDCGDAVLKDISAAINRSVRKTDSVGRWGGEEFLVLLPETDYAGAGRIAEKIRKAVETLRIRHQDETLHVTITAGYAASTGENLEECVKAADEALLRGKADGRNRTVGMKPR